jgi:hypothetical protein
MKYGPITTNSYIDEMIDNCFDYMCEEDKRKFMKKFREQPKGSDQIMHTLGELILGAYLSSIKFKVKHDYAIGEKTPDWSILDDDGKSVSGIVEFTYFHIDKATENEIERQRRAKGAAAYFRDENIDNIDRLYHVIEGKASAYKSLVRKLKVSYVVSVFGESKAVINLEEVRSCLSGAMPMIFDIYPEVSGVLYFFEINSRRYSFNYTRNPSPLQMVEVPNGIFSI